MAESKMPAKIWITMEDHTASRAGAFRRWHASDLDHGDEYPVYIRADLVEQMAAALRFHQLWEKREKEGPLYPFGVTRDAPEGEKIWRAWWNDQLRLCDEAQTRTDAALQAYEAASMTPNLDQERVEREAMNDAH